MPIRTQEAIAGWRLVLRIDAAALVSWNGLHSTLLRLIEVEVHHQVQCERFENTAEVVWCGIRRCPHARSCPEKRIARIRRARELRLELFDIHATFGEHTRDVADDAGTIMPDELEADGMERHSVDPAARRDDNRQTLRFETRQRRCKLPGSRRFDVDAENARELAGEPGRATISPVGASSNYTSEMPSTIPGLSSPMRVTISDIGTRRSFHKRPTTASKGKCADVRRRQRIPGDVCLVLSLTCPSARSIALAKFRALR